MTEKFRRRSGVKNLNPEEAGRVILSIIEPRFASAEAAYAWFHSKPLPGFSDLTAVQLVAEGRSEAVLEYVEAIDMGIHA
ncbi:antitoxin Xre/MbcA/ParS toxin-binding domain-containing protein [Bosea sp. 47.2.35]|uniref:antitoxin Xre/MbcA/ParS toxin-binding domain-containing protein n=1 Tax=Bosea sp. 47.2.35 TaxID=2969304 RepID=UPI00214FDED4|nr:antitoxin Xre/MbcA/ParS toxin-binding domain-containing protein [Bosea sp. 47.2.35]MCR4524747.1 DUF2384 domain-containing protein [Bosea sp. 47.2.35]